MSMGRLARRGCAGSRAAGAQAKVRGRAAEHIGHHDHSVSLVYRVGGVTDLALFGGAVVLREDGDGEDAGLLAHHMLHSGQIFPGQAPVGYDNDPDHRGCPVQAAMRVIGPAPCGLRSG
jgi:hypothetical protein